MLPEHLGRLLSRHSLRVDCRDCVGVAVNCDSISSGSSTKCASSNGWLSSSCDTQLVLVAVLVLLLLVEVVAAVAVAVLAVVVMFSLVVVVVVMQRMRR
jgi:hypothetical protein